MQDAVLFALVVGIGGLLPGLQPLKRDPLLAEQGPQALVADIVDHPVGAENLVHALDLRLRISGGSQQ